VLDSDDITGVIEPPVRWSPTEPNEVAYVWEAYSGPPYLDDQCNFNSSLTVDSMLRVTTVSESPTIRNVAPPTILDSFLEGRQQFVVLH